MNRSPQTLLVFVDGLGLGEADPGINPLYRGDCPFLLDLVDRESVPVDARLGVKGLPQSATGQATLFTGENASAFMGRHVEGTPGPTLKTFVREHNIFDKMQARGYTCTFANAYYIEDMSEVERHRRQSVTTVASFKAFGKVRDAAALHRNEAVYQDLTRHVLRKRGYDGPTVSPAEAGRHLVEIAENFDLTVFEYFQTDLMAHRGTAEDMKRVLSQLDEFLRTFLPLWEGPGRLFVLISDHGNLEDSRDKRHTMNPVPLIARGEGGEILQQKVKSLVDLTPALLGLYPMKNG